MKDVNILINNGVDVQASLESLGDMEMYDETLSDFLELIDEKLASLEKYRSIGDMQNYAILIHALKSDVRYLGFMELGDLAYDSELKSKSGDINGVNANHPLIVEQIKKMVNIANTYLGRIQSSQENTSNINLNQMNNLDPMSQALAQRQEEIKQMPATDEPKKGTILVVDDSSLVANFVKKIFDNRYEVVIANDGAKAIELCSNDEFRSKIKACLLDLNMPNVDGFAVLEEFKQKGYFVKMPVAVISGVENVEQISKARSYPIIDVLAKPFNERDVEIVLEKCLAVYF